MVVRETFFSRTRKMIARQYNTAVVKYSITGHDQIMQEEAINQRIKGNDLIDYCWY